MTTAPRRITATLAASAMALAALAAPVAAAPAPALHVDEILGGYDHPVLVTNSGAANRRIFIVEQSGRIKIAKFDGANWVKVGVFLDLHSIVDYDGQERGLLGLAFAPDYASSGKLYVSYTARGGDWARPADFGPDKVVEYRRKSPNHADPHSARLVLAIPDPYENHNGGDIAFGPDGKLYWGTGDGGSGGDPQNRSQNKGVRLGKMLRINPADPDGSGPKSYSVPSDNPFVGQSGKKPEIWAYGSAQPVALELRPRHRRPLDRRRRPGRLRGDRPRRRRTGGLERGQGRQLRLARLRGPARIPQRRRRVARCPATRCRSSSCPTTTASAPSSAASSTAAATRPAGTASTPSPTTARVTSTPSSPATPPTSSCRTAPSLGVSGFGEDAAGRLYVADVSGGTISTLTFSGSAAELARVTPIRRGGRSLARGRARGGRPRARAGARG